MKQDGASSKIPSQSLSQNVSVVICTKNIAGMLKSCLESIQANAPKEILVVDGLSTDNTREIAQEFGATVLSDEGKGLGWARHVGVQAAQGDWILFVGPDNVLPANFITDFVRLTNEWKFDATCVQTRVQNPKTIWDRGLDYRFKLLKGKPGPTPVVGTPSLYKAKLFKEVNFSAEQPFAGDDTDVCEQLKRKGYKLGVVPLLVFDQNGLSFDDVWKKFRWYGRGDSTFFHQHAASWSLLRKLQSISHPLRQTLNFSAKAIRDRNLEALVWLQTTMVARYYGWISEEVNKR
jgi:glycosyltransferase involved in cell wall biosynthesis